MTRSMTVHAKARTTRAFLLSVLFDVNAFELFAGFG